MRREFARWVAHPVVGVASAIVASGIFFGDLTVMLASGGGIITGQAIARRYR